jgi:hypothetical protein
MVKINTDVTKAKARLYLDRAVLKERVIDIVYFYFPCYAFFMSITRTIEVPVNHRLTIDVPPEVPAGPVILTFTPAETEQNRTAVFGFAKGQFRIAEDSDGIEEVRLLLQKEMAEKGTSTIFAAAGDGWEAHVRERYAES